MFFCKDETVQKNGGIHVIQAFFSDDPSEEIQIQGRTAHQGKRGSYQLILLESDLEDKLGLVKVTKDNIAKDKWYYELCDARNNLREKCYASIEEKLTKTTQKHNASHLYFDSLLEKNTLVATRRYKEIHSTINKGY